jgi:hypothetical protein
MPHSLPTQNTPGYMVPTCRLRKELGSQVASRSDAWRTRVTWAVTGFRCRYSTRRLRRRPDRGLKPTGYLQSTTMWC